MNTEHTAQQTYRQHQNDIAALTGMIEQELKQHAERAAADPKNWGYVGDLNEVKHRLIQALTMISGIHEDTIEESLAEMAEDQISN
jgi:hypothetical protein